MKRAWALSIFLALVAMTCLSTPSYAGSDRWIFTMTPERMAKEKIVHVRFFGPDGTALESDSLQKMLIREQDCNTGHTYEMILDYKMGFAPGNKLVGLFLYSKVWENKTLCFTMPGIGKLEKQLSPADSQDHSIHLKFAP